MDLIPDYFFLDDKLYKKIRLIKSENYIVAWSYEDEKRVWLNYSIVRRHGGKAYTIHELSKLIDKPVTVILSYVKRNLLDRPSGRIYKISNRAPGQFMWSEADILNLRETWMDLMPKNKYGEPYKNVEFVSKAEILSRMRNDASFYVRNENGDFVKVWRAE